MRVRIFSAPSKVFVSGEYAVLWGGEARLAAVGPRAFVAVRRREDREVHVVLEQGRLVGVTTPLGLRWESEPSAAFRFAADAIDVALRANGRESLGFELVFSSSAAATDGTKWGLGSSARASVLASEAARYALDASHDALKAALYSHWFTQGQRGSGGDVATCFSGGLVRYRRFEVESLHDATRADRFPQALRTAGPVEVQRLAPPKFPMLYVASGQSASTPVLIASIEKRITGPVRETFVRRSDGLGIELEAALVQGDFDSVRNACDDLTELLGGLGPLETAGLHQCRTLAVSLGAAAKLSGAGGGDSCLVFCPNEETRTELARVYAERGRPTLRLSTEPGLQTELEAPQGLLSWFSRPDSQT